MSYTTESAKLSRQPFSIVKLELDTTISATGTEYHCNGRSPLGQVIYSTIQDNGIDITPTTMAIASGLGFRGTITVKLKDFNFGDNGTYFGKLLANNPYYLDRKLKWYDGFYDGVTFDWANFNERLYFIKKIDGPDSNGNVTITASDPLTQLDEDEAQTPTTPAAKLVSGLAAATTGTVNITDNSNFDSGGGVGQIGDELVTYSGISGVDSIVITARGQWGTTATSASAGDNVSPVYSYSAVNVVDVIRDLIQTYSPFDYSSYLNDTDWNAERDTYLIGAEATGIVPAGTAIKKKIESLCEQFMISVWWDDEAQQIKLRAIGNILTATRAINSDDNILNVGESVKRDPTKGVTSLLVYYGRINFASDQGKPSNYSDIYLSLDTTAYSGYGKEKTKTVYADDIPSGSTVNVSRLATRLAAIYQQGETTYSFQLDVKDAENLFVGDFVDVTTDAIQGIDGVPNAIKFIIVERDRIKPTVYQFKTKQTGFSIGTPYRVIAPTSLAATTYTAATATQQQTYGFIADTATGQFSNSDPGHEIL